MHIEIRQQAFDPWAELHEYETGLAIAGSYGATAVFVGSMRDFNEQHQVRSMHLEYYPGMTERYLEKIAAAANEHWDMLDCLILHRVGEIAVSDSIVLVAVWSAHRADAFAASRYIMEELKSRAPFWKKEMRADGERWVEKNTPG
jgi:molybdopterin synthase catalytic subunit